MAKDSSQEPAQHVPAWKKIGLKLKYAKDTAEQDAGTYSKPVEESINIESENSNAKDKKKRKKSSETNGEETKSKKRRHAATDDNDDKETDVPKSRKKRVSFGAGTKTKDGSDDDSSETVTGMDESSEPKVAAEQEADKAIEEMKQRKREKKKERKAGVRSSASAQIHETPILSYLSRYYRDRTLWKFQKNRETNIFRHLYSLEHVPSQYNAALLAYMQGLKGDAAKMRLSQAAAEVIQTDMDVQEKEGNQSTAREYQRSVDVFRDSLSAGGDGVNEVGSVEGLGAETQKRLRKRQRAELVFFAVSGSLCSGVVPRKEVGKNKTKAETPSQKKRKNRTAVVEISSSSESDDSEESESDASGDEGDKKKSAAAGKTAPGKSVSYGSSDESTSSSGSSDSDSDDTPARRKTAVSAKKNKASASMKVSQPAPSKNKKKQKRKVRTAQIEISSSSESDSD